MRVKDPRKQEPNVFVKRVKTIHCEYRECDKVFAYQSEYRKHIKRQHATPEEIAEGKMETSLNHGCRIASTSLRSYMTLLSKLGTHLPHIQTEDINEDNETAQLLCKIQSNFNEMKEISVGYHSIEIVMIESKFCKPGMSPREIVLKYWKRKDFTIKIFSDSSGTFGPCDCHETDGWMESSNVTFYARKGWKAFFLDKEWNSGPENHDNKDAALFDQHRGVVAGIIRSGRKQSEAVKKIEWINSGAGNKGCLIPFKSPDVIQAMKVAYYDGIPDFIKNSADEDWYEYDLEERIEEAEPDKNESDEDIDLEVESEDDSQSEEEEENEDKFISIRESEEEIDLDADSECMEDESEEEIDLDADSECMEDESEEESHSEAEEENEDKFISILDASEVQKYVQKCHENICKFSAAPIRKVLASDILIMISLGLNDSLTMKEIAMWLKANFKPVPGTPWDKFNTGSRKYAIRNVLANRKVFKTGVKVKGQHHRHFLSPDDTADLNVCLDLWRQQWGGHVREHIITQGLWAKIAALNFDEQHLHSVAVTCLSYPPELQSTQPKYDQITQCKVMKTILPLELVMAEILKKQNRPMKMKEIMEILRINFQPLRHWTYANHATARKRFNNSNYLISEGWGRSAVYRLNMDLLDDLEIELCEWKTKFKDEIRAEISTQEMMDILFPLKNVDDKLTT